MTLSAVNANFTGLFDALFEWPGPAIGPRPRARFPQ